MAPHTRIPDTPDGVQLRQSYQRVGKHALIAHQRYAHAKQFKRANRALRTIRTHLGRVTRDIVRKIKGDAALESVSPIPLMLARRVREQLKHQRGKKVYLCTRPRSSASARARPIGPMSSASRSRSPPRSIAPRRPVHRPRQGDAGQSLRRPHPRDRDPGDRDADRREPPRIVADRGYRGHNAPPDHKFKVYISGQRRRVTETIKRELRRRSAVEPVIGHAKAEHRMGRNHSPGPMATPPTPFSPQPATTSAGSSNGWRFVVHNPGRPERPVQSGLLLKPA